MPMCFQIIRQKTQPGRLLLTERIIYLNEIMQVHIAGPIFLVAFFLLISCSNGKKEKSSESRSAPVPEAPLLLKDQAEITAYINNFPTDSYNITEVPGLGSFYLDKYLEKDIIKDVLRNKKIYEAHLFDLLRKFIRPGDKVVDIGAHIGTITLPMSKLVGSNGLVYAFEPQKKIYRELWHNIKLNKLENVRPLRFAIGRKTGIVEMNPPERGNEGGTSVGFGGDKVELSVKAACRQS
jgi:hypothetical protein